MIVIKEFDSNGTGIEASEFVEFCDAYHLGNKLIVATAPSGSGTILLNSVCPTLVKTYQGIAIHEAKGVTLALYSKDSSSYRSWNGSEWIESEEPSYQTLEEVNQGISQWCGDLQIKLHLDELAAWRNLQIAYHVNTDLPSWLLEFGAINYFAKPIEFSCVTTCNDGRHVLPPPYVNLKAMTDVMVQPLHGKCTPAQTNSNCDAIALFGEVIPGTVQLHYTLTPQVDYIYGEHQISESPCVTIRSLGETNRRNAMRHCHINGSLIQTIYQYDLLFEVAIVADRIEDVRNIAHRYATLLRTQGRILAYPFDEEFGIELMGIMKENYLPEVEGDLPSITFSAKIRNLYLQEIGNDKEFGNYLF